MSSLDLLEDACARLPHATRGMFGGHGLFAPNGGIFGAIVDEDRIILKLAEDAPRAELVALGGAPWTYRGRMTMRDWIVVPDRFYDEPALLAEWATRAHRIAKPPKPKSEAKAKEAATWTGKRSASSKPAKRPAAKPKERASAKGKKSPRGPGR